MLEPLTECFSSSHQLSCCCLIPFSNALNYFFMISFKLEVKSEKKHVHEPDWYLIFCFIQKFLFKTFPPAKKQNSDSRHSHNGCRYSVITGCFCLYWNYKKKYKILCSECDFGSKKRNPCRSGGWHNPLRLPWYNSQHYSRNTSLRTATGFYL